MVTFEEPEPRRRRRPAPSLVPPDGGWGWMVVLGSFLTFVAVDGISYSFGIIYIELLEYFDATKGETSWIGSLVVGWAYLVGPIASSITDRYGCRVTAMAGALLASIGFMLSALIQINIYFLYFTFGTIGGIGIGLIYLPSVVCVGQYFDKYRALATGIALCGTGVGTFTMAPVAQLLVNEFGWRGTFVIISGIMLNCLAFGALFRPLVTTHQCLDCLYTNQTNESIDDDQPPDEEDYPSKSNTPPELRSSKLYQLSQLSLNKSPPIEYRPIPTKELFWSLPFVLFCVSNFLTHLGYCAPYTFLPHQAELAGIEKTEAAFLISVMGLTNMLGRVGFGWLGDRIGEKRIYLYSTSAVVNGVAAALMPVMTSYRDLIIVSSVFGLSASSLFGLTSVVLVDLLGLENLVRSFGVLIVGRGFATIMGAPLLGLVFDHTGSYLYTFILAGACITLSGLIVYVTPCVGRLQAARTEARKEASTGIELLT